MPLNLAHHLTRSARRFPDAPAILHGDVERSYAWLDDRVGRLASGLLQLGLKPGDRVGLIVETEPRSIECLLAPLRAGLAIVPVNYHLHPAEHAYMLNDCGARAVLCSASRTTALLDKRDQMPAVAHVIAMDGAGAGEAGVQDYEALIAASAPIPDVPVSHDTLSWIFYTSGTTGHPKGAVHTHRSLGAMVDAQIIEIWPNGPGERLAHVTPMSHAAGLLVFHHTAGAGAHVFPDFTRFEPEAFYRMVDRHKVTKASLVPTMIHRLLDGAWPVPYDISSLQTVQYGGAPLHLEPLNRALDRFGPIFVNVYAQGEAPLACTILPKAEHVATDEVTKRRLRSVGRACYGAEVAIFGSDDCPVAAETSGEIVVRGDLVMQGYWGAPEAMAETLRGGWLHTGDVGHMDEEGYLYITDRVKDMVIKGGTNIYPREIEEILHRHEDVREVAVFGVPDDEWGEIVAAAVVLRDGAVSDADALIDWCRASMANFKLPTTVHFVDELAKSGYGKILKREIRAALYPALSN
ncbi:MAG: AMP-binding protein [Alphaproteobacteria bacterium]|nr:AMP-binding protein [Alphaproteobacteria bacterium]